MGEIEGVKGAWGYVEGGMGSVSAAIANCAIDHGASVFTDKVNIMNIKFFEYGIPLLWEILRHEKVPETHFWLHCLLEMPDCLLKKKISCVSTSYFRIFRFLVEKILCLY